MSLIIPSIGRKVWYWAEKPASPSAQPEDATICYVHSPSIVNLRVTSHTGGTRPVSSVFLIPSDSEHQFTEGDYATWMPYQVGQATKEAEKAAQVPLTREQQDAVLHKAAIGSHTPPPIPSVSVPSVPGKPLG